MTSYDRGDTHNIYVATRRRTGLLLEPDSPPTVDIYAKNGGAIPTKVVDGGLTTKIEDGLYVYPFSIGDTDPYGDYLVVSKALFSGRERKGTGIFSVQVDTASIVLEESGYGIILQYTKVALLSTMRIKFKCPSGRSDVKINILNPSGVHVITDQFMTELAGSGVYEYNWSPSIEGQYTVICTTEGIEDSMGINVISGQGSVSASAVLT